MGKPNVNMVFNSIVEGSIPIRLRQAQGSPRGDDPAYDRADAPCTLQALVAVNLTTYQAYSVLNVATRQARGF